MSKKRRLFIYVGPHRSGSLYLRDQILPHVPGVYSTHSRDPVVNGLVLDAMEGHPLFVDPAAIRRQILDRLAGVEEQTIVVSDPEFFGDYGRHDSGGDYIIQPFHDNPQRTELLFRIFDCPEFESPKVMMSMRRQDMWIESAYMHFVHNSWIFPFDDFLRPHGVDGVVAFTSRSKTPGVDVKALDWSVYVRNYHRVFGAENVLVLPFEMGTSELRTYLDRLYDFMGCERYYPDQVPTVNPSLSATAFKLARLLGPLVHSKQSPYGFLPNRPFIGWIQRRRKVRDTRLLWFLAGISRRISLFWFLRDVVSKINYERPDHLGRERRQAILDHYRESNREYGRLIGVDLGKYGYY